MTRDEYRRKVWQTYYQEAREEAWVLSPMTQANWRTRAHMQEMDLRNQVPWDEQNEPH